MWHQHAAVILNCPNDDTRHPASVRACKNRELRYKKHSTTFLSCSWDTEAAGTGAELLQVVFRPWDVGICCLVTGSVQPDDESRQ